MGLEHMMVNFLFIDLDHQVAEDKVDETDGSESFKNKQLVTRALGKCMKFIIEIFMFNLLLLLVFSSEYADI